MKEAWGLPEHSKANIKREFIKEVMPDGTDEDNARPCLGEIAGIT
jgi:hypothetical protein